MTRPETLASSASLHYEAAKEFNDETFYLAPGHQHSLGIIHLKFFLAELLCQFSDCAAMPHRNRMHADKGFVVGIEQLPFSRYAIDRVWSIQYNDCSAGFLANTHGEIQRPNKSVITRSNILKVDQQNIQAFQHFCRRFAMIAVKTVDRDVQARMLVTLPLQHVVLRLAEKSMLWAKKGGEAKQIATVSLQDWYGVQFCGNRSRMNQRTDTRAAKFVRPKFW